MSQLEIVKHQVGHDVLWIKRAEQVQISIVRKTSDADRSIWRRRINYIPSFVLLSKHQRHERKALANVSLQSVRLAIILCSFVDALVYCPVNSMLRRVTLPWSHPIELVAELDPLSVAIPLPVCHRSFENTERTVPKLIVVIFWHKFVCDIPEFVKNFITQRFCCFPESCVLVV